MNFVRGRFAPSPTGPLHLGNLRTALVAWLMARRVGGEFIVRMEDLDRVTSSPEHEAGQLAALRSIGLDWDGEVVRQSERFALYRAAIDRLRSLGLVYECFCTRSEIRQSARAPQGADLDGVYPGTCRHLTEEQRLAKRAAGRSPALRLLSDGRTVSFDDLVAGPQVGRRSTMSCCNATMACPRTTWQWWSTTPRKGVTEGPRRRPAGDDTEADRAPSAARPRRCRGTRTFRSCSPPMDRAWRNGTAR